MSKYGLVAPNIHLYGDINPQIYVLSCPPCIFGDTLGLSHPKKLSLADRKNVQFSTLNNTLNGLCCSSI